MGDALEVYQKRLEAWKVHQFPGQSKGDVSLKFDIEGVAKPFYGMTIVAFIEPASVMYHNLCDYQCRIKRALVSEGLESHFSFLDPVSLHMTLCDIVAGPSPLKSELIETTVNTARSIFPQLKISRELSCQLRELGLDMSLMQLANFDSEGSLNQCLHLERALKQAFVVDQRSFLGHVSLAYFVKKAGADWERIIRALSPFSRDSLGEFTFAKISLCHFSNMNSYTPLLTVDLLTGQLTSRGKWRIT